MISSLVLGVVLAGAGAAVVFSVGAGAAVVFSVGVEGVLSEGADEEGSVAAVVFSTGAAVVFSCGDVPGSVLSALAGVLPEETPPKNPATFS